MNWLSAITPMGRGVRPHVPRGPAAADLGLPGDEAGADGEADLEGCGWFDSSHSLRAGLEIVELGAGALTELFAPPHRP